MCPSSDDGDTVDLEPVPAAAEPVADLPQRIGPYTILRKIAEGGMGAVYQAWQQDLNRVVALKLLKNLEGAHEQAIARFRIEAAAAARLRHPNIVGIYEVGEEGGLPYFTMEYVEGQSLAEALLQAVFRPEASARLVKTVAEAMDYAHGLGVVHRDLKPANIMIDATQRPVVTDFGLAKDIVSDASLTRTGQIVGTVYYMSPEQATGRSRDIDARSDVFALGVILYEMLTGRVPFDAPSVIAILKKIDAEDPVPPRRLRGDIPADLQTVCLKAMEKDPDRRYASAAELAADLGRFVAGEPIAARPQSMLYRLQRRLARNRALTLTILVSLSALASGGLLTAQGLDREAARLLQSQAQARRLEEAAQRRARARKAFDRVGDLGARGRELDLVREAIAVYDATLAVDPDYAEAYYYRGRAWLRLGRHDAALADFLQAVERDENRPDAWYYAGLTRLRRLQRRAQEEVHYDPETARGRGFQALARAEFLSAQVEFERAVEREPEGIYHLVSAAHLAFCQRDEPGPILGALDEAQRRDPLFPETYYLRAALLGFHDLGISDVGQIDDKRSYRFKLKEIHRPAQAMADLARYHELDPLSVDGRFLAAWIAADGRNFAEAEAELDLLLQIDPDHPKALQMRAQIRLHFARHQDALVDAERCARLQSESYHAQVRWALGLIALKRPGTARTVLRAAVQRFSDQEGRYETHLLLAVLAAGENDYASAAIEIQWMLERNQGMREMVEGLSSARFDRGPLAGLFRSALSDAGRVFLLDIEAKEGVRLLEAFKRETPVIHERVAAFRKHRRMGLEQRNLFGLLSRPDQADLLAALDRGRELGHWQVDLVLLSRMVGHFVLMEDEEALERHEVLHTAADWLARAAGRYRAGRYAEAKEDLKRACELDPRSLEVHYGLATVLGLLARDDPRLKKFALRYLGYALALGWQRMDETERDPDFSALRRDPQFKKLVELGRGE